MHNFISILIVAKSDGIDLRNYKFRRTKKLVLLTYEFHGARTKLSNDLKAQVSDTTKAKYYSTSRPQKLLPAQKLKHNRTVRKPQQL